MLKVAKEMPVPRIEEPLERPLARPMPPDGDSANVRPVTPAKSTLTDDEKLTAFRIADEARGQFLSWLKWTFGIFILFLGLLGLKGYNDWTAILEAHRKELDRKVQQHVDENLKANYKARTEEVLASALRARTEIAMSSRIVDDLQKQSKELEAEQNRFRDKLALLEGQAQGTAQDVRTRLARLAADFGPEDLPRNDRIRQQQFLSRSRAYAAKLGVTIAEPRIVFREDASWPFYDVKDRVYVINPRKMDSAGLAEYAALMGRFLEKNREGLANLNRPGFPDQALWQNFRMSVVEYLLVKDGLTKEEADKLDFYRRLMVMDEKTGTTGVRKLAVALLEAFGSDWNSSNFVVKVLAVNEKLQAVPADDLQRALANFPSVPSGKF